MTLRKLILFLVLSLIINSGCASTQKADNVSFFFTPDKLRNKQDFSAARQVVMDINERKRFQEQSQEWLREAYGSLKIRKLNDIPPGAYKGYKRFSDADNGRVYIVVHPAFYAFFTGERIIKSSKKEGEPFPSKNIVERLYESASSYDSTFRLMQEQERVLRDFLEVTAAQKKLLLLILPRDYRKHLTCGYSDGVDEYARYINEVANMSDSVLFMESVEFDNGALQERDLDVLAAFLNDIDASAIMLGGGFFGRCLELFYNSLGEKISPDRLYVVPEIISIASADLDDSVSEALLRKDGKINFRAISKGMEYSKQDTFRNFKHLYIYELRTPARN